MNYYTKKDKDGDVHGPYTVEQLASQLESGSISADYLVTAALGETIEQIRRQRQSDWFPITKVSGLGRTVSPLPSSAQQPIEQSPEQVTSSVAAAPQTSLLAIWSCVIGIAGIVVGFFLLPGAVFLASPVSIVCAIIALTSISRSRGALGGRGSAILGLLAGCAGAVLSVAIAIKGHEAYSTAQRVSCIMNMRAIQGAKISWAIHNKKGGDYPTAAQLVGTGSLEAMPICPSGGSYTIGSVDGSPSCSIRGHEDGRR